MNTPNVKVRMLEEERKTTLHIKHATEEDDATYVCKATSEIGLATTKAKLRVTGELHYSFVTLGNVTFHVTLRKITYFSLPLNFILLFANA